MADRAAPTLSLSRGDEDDDGGEEAVIDDSNTGLNDVCDVEPDERRRRISSCVPMSTIPSTSVRDTRHTSSSAASTRLVLPIVS